MEGVLLIKKLRLIGSSWSNRYCVLNPDTGVLAHYSGTSASGASKEVVVARADACEALVDRKGKKKPDRFNFVLLAAKGPHGCQ